MRVDAKIIDGNKIVATKALIDSGAQGNFINDKFAKKHRLPLLKLKKEIPISNVDNTPNKSGPIRFHTRLLLTVDGKTYSIQFMISDLGKDNVILGLPWLKFINPEIDWTKKTLKVIRERIKLPSIKQCILNEFDIRAVELARKKRDSQESFAEELRNLPERKKQKKTPNVTIEEIEDEDAAPRYPRLPDTEKSILIAVADLPDDYENMSPMTTKTEEEDDVENDFLIKQLREEPLPEEVAIKAKTSISQSLAHKAETGEMKTFGELVPKEYHKFRSVFEKTASE